LIVLDILWLLSIINYKIGAWWRFGRVDSFCPKGHGFGSRSNLHLGTLGKSFTHSTMALWREIPAQYPRCVGSASEWWRTWRGAI